MAPSSIPMRKSSDSVRVNRSICILMVEALTLIEKRA